MYSITDTPTFVQQITNTFYSILCFMYVAISFIAVSKPLYNQYTLKPRQACEVASKSRKI